MATPDATNSNVRRTKKRRKPGRATRRRRKKALEIERVEQAVRSCQPAASVVAPRIPEREILPIDREFVWPAVAQLRLKYNWNTQSDEADLISQLGYVPGNSLRVTARIFQVPCLLLSHDKKEEQRNIPIAIQLYPIVLRNEHVSSSDRVAGNSFKRRKRKRHKNGEPTGNHEARSQQVLIEPFPTMFWLTHPLLRAMISKLEVAGFGVKFEKRLESDTEAQQRMERAHQAYGRERYNLLTDDDHKIIQQRQWQAAFAPTRGVAGIRNYKAVKCLHAHAAHYLSSDCDGSSDNVIGEWVMEEVERLMSNETKEANPVDSVRSD